MELPLAKCKANFLPDDTVLQHFIQVLNTRLRIFNKLLRHQLDIRLDNKNVYDTYFNKRGRRRKKINVVVKKHKLGILPRPFFNLLTSEVAFSGWLNDVLRISWVS